MVRITSAPALPAATGAVPADVPAPVTSAPSGVLSTWKAGACFRALCAAAALWAAWSTCVAADAVMGWSSPAAVRAIAIRQMLDRTGGSRRESKAMTSSEDARLGLSIGSGGRPV